MLVLTAGDIAGLLSPAVCRRVVEAAFRDLGEGRAEAPVVAGVHVTGGGFHIKAGVLGPIHPRFVAKTNANFPANPARGLPTIQGAVLLFDAGDGSLLALLDSGSLTCLRTAAATAVAAGHLARPDSGVLLLCGCGEQGMAHLHALVEVLPIHRVIAFDRDESRAGVLADAARGRGLEAAVSTDLRAGLRECDLCVTCTPSTEWFVDVDDVRPGTFIAGVGADSPQKQELSPALLAAASVWVDLLDQCVAIGDLHHAIEAGAMRRESVRGELAGVVCGSQQGRLSDDEIIVFDSTGMALQDAAAASAVFDRAVEQGRGFEIQLSESAG
jgi:ornithine cyclodeaminase/alanine dehydrogenase-like protein (mu-crystallin family)